MRRCPHCQASAEGTFNIDPDDPIAVVENSGSTAWVVCVYCSGVSVIEPGQGMRLPIPAEAIEAAHDVNVLRAVAAVDYWRAVRGR